MGRVEIAALVASQTADLPSPREKLTIMCLRPDSSIIASRRTGMLRNHRPASLGPEGEESRYRLTTVEQLIEDFLADVRGAMNRTCAGKVNVHVGTMEDMGRRFVSAWHRLENGENVRERHLAFDDLPALLNALTPKRLELLREVCREAAPSVRVLANRLSRDYQRVHGDVDTLSTVGVLVHDEAGISAPTSRSSS